MIYLQSGKNMNFLFHNTLRSLIFSFDRGIINKYLDKRYCCCVVEDACYNNQIG